MTLILALTESTTWLRDRIGLTERRPLVQGVGNGE